MRDIETAGSSVRRTNLFVRMLMAGLLLGAAVPAGAFHFPWDQGHDTTQQNPPPPPGPCEGPLCTPCGSTGSPVYIPTGHFLWSEKDVEIYSRRPLSMTRTYNSNDPRDGMFGRGWTAGCEEALVRTVDLIAVGQDAVTTRIGYVLRLSDGKRYEFERQEDGTIAAPAGRHERLEDAEDGRLLLTTPLGSSRLYSPTGKLLRDMDRNGVETSYTYDDSDRLIRIADGFGQFIDLAYNPAGRVDTVQDHTGRTWSYTYDTTGNLVAMQDPLGGVTTYSYQPYTPPGDGNTYQLLTRIVDPTGVVRSQITYSNGQVRTYSDGENVYTYTYNPTARRTTKRDRRNSTYTFEYDERQVITREIDPLGNVVTSTYDDQGNLIQTTDEAGSTWTAEYDEQGRPVLKTDPLGNSVSWGYQGDFTWPVRLVTPMGKEIRMLRDVSGNLITYTDPSGASIENVWSDDGLLLQTTDAEGNVVRYEYDDLGRKTATIGPLGNVTSAEYDALSRVIVERDGNGNVRRYTYDDLGRVVQVDDRLGGTTGYAYDAASRLLSVTDARGNITTNVYDSFGRLASTTRPDGSTTTYTYYQDNRISRIAHPGGTSITYTYDAAKRLTGKVAGAVSYSYGYNGRGQLVTASNPAGSLQRSYDGAGQLVAETFRGQTVQYGLNADGERASITALGATTAYVRDQRGLITRIDDMTGTYDFTYSVNGLRSSLSYPNGEAVQLTRNAEQRVTRIDHQGPFQNVRSYQLDPVGNILSMQVDGETISYSYDSKEQLLSADYAAETFSYAYDEAGNLIDNGKVYDAANRLLSDLEHTFEYDARGNLTQKTVIATGARTVYSWSAQNELLQVLRFEDAAATVPVENMQFEYGPLGRRAAKTLNGVTERYVYDGFNRIGTLDGNGAVTARVVFGPGIDAALGMQTPAGDRFFHYDALGSVVAISDETSVVSEFTYAPYGTLLEGDVSATPFGFTGREMDAAHLYFYRSRYYDPTIQRFLSEDPIGFGGGLNFYAYVDGNPVKNTDPLGLATYMCSKPLDAMGGDGTRSGPDIWGNPLYHQYICIRNGETTSCGGQQFQDSWLYGPGEKSDDQFVPERCEQEEPDNQCLEKCLTEQFAEPRPNYSLIGPGTNCQEWADDTLARCRNQCKANK